MRETRAYCYASGEIEFGKRVPNGTIEIVRGEDQRVRDLVSVRARLAYDGETLLVPGIPEAENENAKLDALKRFSDWIKETLSKDKNKTA